MLVYHGSKEKFDTFDFLKIGKNGTSEGKGIYFTDNYNIAKGYADTGFLYTVNFKGKKSLSSTQKLITKAQLKKFILALQQNENTEYLSNWGDIEYDSLNKVLSLAVESTFNGSDNDVDMISGIVGATGEIKESMEILYSTLGYDCIILPAEWGKQTLYIALINDVIEITNVDQIN